MNDKLGLSFVCYLALGCMFLGSLNGLSAAIFNFQKAEFKKELVASSSLHRPKGKRNLLTKLFNLYAGNPTRKWLHAAVASLFVNECVGMAVSWLFPVALLADIVLGVCKVRKKSFKELDFGNPARLALYSSVAGHMIYLLNCTQMKSYNIALSLHIAMYVIPIFVACTVYDLVLCARQLKQEDCDDEQVKNSAIEWQHPPFANW